MAELQRKLDLASAAVKISSLLVAPADLDAALDESLRIMGEVTGAGRAYIFMFRDDGVLMDNTHEWCTAGVEAQIALLKDIVIDDTPWWMARMRSGETVHIPNVTDLPPEASAERGILEAQDIKSLVAFPLRVKDALGGFIGLDNVIDARPWGGGEMDLLRLSAEAIGGAIGRRRAESAARRSEALYRDLFELSPDAIVMTDLACTAVTLNLVAAEMLGRESPDELVGQEVLEWFVSEDRDRAAAYARAALHTGEQRGGRFSVKQRDGSRVQIETNARLLRDARGERRGLVLVSRDITQQIQLQAKLAQSNRLASVGLLAAGVAHEINNPLTYVLYNMMTLNGDLLDLARNLEKHRLALSKELGEQRSAELLGDFPTSRLRELRKLVDTAIGGGQRIHDIVSDLKTFSRVEEDPRSLVHVNSVIDSVINMARNEIKYRARIIKDYEGSPLLVAPEGRVFQVFLNLVVNAAQAIEDGDVAHNEVRVRTRVQDGEVAIEVSDTGCGIPEEILDRVFDPFFSSKPLGEGTGLGLSISHSIVSTLGGHIDVVSEVGRGTRVTVRLPLPSPEELEELGSPPPRAPDESERARGRILVIDDEPQVGKSLSRLLGKVHQVKVASSGREAMSLIEEDQGFHVLLCDVIMPDVSGIDLYWWLHERFPLLAARTVFMTAGAFTARARAFFDRTAIPCLSKPFDLKAVQNLVQEMLRSQ